MHIVFYQIEVFDTEDGVRHVLYKTRKNKGYKVTFGTWVKILVEALVYEIKYKYEVLRIEVIDIESM